MTRSLLSLICLLKALRLSFGINEVEMSWQTEEYDNLLLLWTIVNLQVSLLDIQIHRHRLETHWPLWVGCPFLFLEESTHVDALERCSTDTLRSRWSTEFQRRGKGTIFEILSSQECLCWMRWFAISVGCLRAWESKPRLPWNIATAKQPGTWISSITTLCSSSLLVTVWFKPKKSLPQSSRWFELISDPYLWSPSE